MGKLGDTGRQPFAIFDQDDTKNVMKLALKKHFSLRRGAAAAEAAGAPAAAAAAVEVAVDDAAGQADDALSGADDAVTEADGALQDWVTHQYCLLAAKKCASWWCCHLCEVVLVPCHSVLTASASTMRHEAADYYKRCCELRSLHTATLLFQAQVTHS